VLQDPLVLTELIIYQVPKVLRGKRVTQDQQDIQVPLVLKVLLVKQVQLDPQVFRDLRVPPDYKEKLAIQVL